jgi:threonine dehydrogenase-like Zn-dependent dehydrogenase
MARALVLVEPGRLEERSFPLPEIGAEDGLLRVTATGICGSDVHQFHGRLAGAPCVTPTVPGHEIVGVLEQAGPAALARWGVAEGDLVVLEEVVTCGECQRCRAGGPGCERMRVYGLSTKVDEPPGLWGGYATHVYLHPRVQLHRVPDGVSAEEAALFVPIANGIRWGATVPGTRPGDTVVVLGPGQQGLGCLVGALSAGATRVFVTGRTADAERLAVAERLGAAATVDVDRVDPVATVGELTGGRGADIVVDATAGAVAAIPQAIEMTRSGGTVILGGLKGMAEIPGFVSDKVVLKQLRLQGVGGHDHASVAAALELIASRRFPLEAMRTHVMALRDAEAAIRLVGREGATGGPDPIHVTLVP